MQRDEKLLDAGVESLIQRVQELRNSIMSFVVRLEQEYTTLNWPTVLDNFALLSGQISTLNRLLKSDKMPQLKNFVVIPLALSPDRDPELEKVTEGRLPCFSHDAAPAYLRTKPEPEVEEKMAPLQNRGSQIASTEQLQKQVNMLNKLTTTMLETIKNSREQCEDNLGRQATMQSMSSQSDTNALIAAVAFGKSLKHSPQAATPSAGPSSGLSEQRIQMPPGPQSMPMSKAPSTIKTNIKAAAGVHPYGRP